ncbi:hypothetical protein Bpfe_004095 [Biomphalaria pfeifferi]|uniref:ADP-ribosylglycohydrolase n=1 Tax=Biomphalaria pfeifferi TaxID=112525 RepID=A0AAD8FJX7_BIOPF|nr:hypothetical protein Bpfe_004095 [Biomphalaria pfeifferi]
MVLNKLTSRLTYLQRTCCVLYKAALAPGNPHICFQSQAVSSRCLTFTVTASAASVFTLLFLSQTPPQLNSPASHVSRKHSIVSGSEDTVVEEKSMEEVKIMSRPQLSDQLKKAKAEAIWGLFVADALSMPVHWYYEPSDIKHEYGSWISGFIAPHGKHPSSILRLSAVDGSGRGASSTPRPLIGNVILHDKLQYWDGSNPNNHYHQGMKAGDNTLNAVMALHELQTMNLFDGDLIKPDRDVRAAVLEDYVKFMTTPGSHNDTYAESFHRSFFRAWADSGEPKSAADLIEFAEKRSLTMLKSQNDHQLAVVGSLVPAIPWVIRNAHKPENECVQSVVDFVKLTHPVPSLVSYVEVYARLLHAVLNGRDLKTQVMQFLGNSILGGPSNRDKILKRLDDSARIPRGTETRLQMYQSMISLLGSACYIEGALKSLLFLALEFHDDFEGGVLANANCGGENCHRGAALGALLAAAAANRGAEVPTKFKSGLNSLKPNIESVIKDIVT